LLTPKLQLRQIWRVVDWTPAAQEEIETPIFSSSESRAMTSILFLLIGLLFGAFVQAGGGILAGAFHLTPWLTLWWGIGLTVYVIVKDYWMPKGKRFRDRPHWRQAILLTVPWSIALFTAINYGTYLVLHWTSRLLHFHA
jgi:hypothetical protein